MIKKPTANQKKWPKYCFFAALGLIVFAGLLYVIHCFMLSGEFGRYEKFFGKQYDEIFSLNMTDEDRTDPLLAEGKAALRFIGTQEECDAFGVFAPWCVSLDAYPEAQSVKVKLECITAELDGGSGYLWVAYTQKVLDADGETIFAKGTADERCLARWTLKKLDGKWTVTQIKEENAP